MFALTYMVKGMNYDSVLNMTSRDRMWYLRRLLKQLDFEKKKMKAK